MSKSNKVYKYIRNRNLINRIYDMLEYYNFFKDREWSKKEIREYLKTNIYDVYFVETLAKYFDVKLHKPYTKKKVELKCNLKSLIDDLNYIKQYLE